MATKKFFQFIIRSAADDADEFVFTSAPGGDNPYITEAPSGDGNSIDPLTGKPTTGAYSVRVADAMGLDGRVVTSILADVNARQQLIARKAVVRTGETLGFADEMVTGYITAVRLITAISYEFGIGQSRRIENSREIFKTATSLFPSTTSIIGGPILGGFSTLVPEPVSYNGGWRFKVMSSGTGPSYVRILVQDGFDPRGKYSGYFGTTVNSAITDYNNNYTRPYFQPFPIVSSFVSDMDIRGHFPLMRVRLIPVTNPGDPTIDIVPLSYPDIFPDWFGPSKTYDLLTLAGNSSIYLETSTATDASTGLPVAFAPADNDEFNVYVFALPISDKNPLHIYRHPVDIWEDLMIENRVAYDDTVLPALKTLIDTTVDGDTRLMLRITQTYKLADFLQQVIYGPFRLSTKLVDGKQVLFSIRVRDALVVQTITPAELRSDETTLFDLDESTVVTAITLKTKRIYLWSTTESDTPPADTLLIEDSSEQSLENSNDDIPGWDGDSIDSPTVREVTIGDIPGMIIRDSTDPAINGPVDFDRFIADIGDEMFDRMGRGAIGCELPCLPTVMAQVGELVTLELPRLPVALSSQSPVSQRGPSPNPRNFQVTQRTELPEGSTLKLVDAEVTTEPTYVVSGADIVVDSTGRLVVAA